MRKCLLFSIGMFIFFVSRSQEKNVWTPVNESLISKNLFEGRYKPPVYKLFQLKEADFQADLGHVPSERNVAAGNSSFIITVPDAEGIIERFRLVEAPVMEASLAARYPQIKSYAGKGIDNPSSVIRCDISPRGFHAMILSPERKTIYIDPVERINMYYVVFARQDIMDAGNTFKCLTADSNPGPAIDQLPFIKNADDGRLRTYRLALACTGEYAQYFLNGTETTDAQRKIKVLAAMNTLITRTDGIYERDFGIRMNMIGNNDALIYLNPSTDPWTTEWNSKTQQTIDAVIGSANYDIGHLVHKEANAANNNGNAGCIGCVCKAGQKGSAFTSHVNPEGDPFVVDYTTHEMGHQFGANHTFTFSNEGTVAQVEPGSGSTIMGYAGITGVTTDVQPHSDDYFHGVSIQQVTDYIKSATGGGTCAQLTVIGDRTPTANAGGDYIIPKSTPFALTGTGTDADAGDVLTYGWEEMDKRATGFTTVPSATASAGPQFRSVLPVNSPTRYFPDLASILSGANSNKWEVLPSVSRIMNFRFTVRDNHPGGGNNNSDDITVTVAATAGPFAVTAPNTAVTWGAGTSQTITWSVNSTNVVPVNCTSVNILLSTNGGNTFPITLASGSANDGSQIIIVPNNPGNQCRVKVQAVGNIFFDISSVNFTITGTGPSCNQPASLASPGITSGNATVSWAPATGAVNYTIDYKNAVSSAWINAATATTATSTNLSGLSPATVYDWRVRTNCMAGNSDYSTAQFTTAAAASCGVPAGLSTLNITTNSATISWSAITGANSYTADYKISSSPTWINAITATTATSFNLSALSSSASYDWRVRTNCSSGSSIYATAGFTTTDAPAACPGSYDISTNGTTNGAATISLNTDVKGLITPAGDNDYYRFTITNAGTITITLKNLSGDYDIRLYNAAGAQLAISQNGGTTAEAINFTVAAGTYYVRAYPFSTGTSATSCYTLRVATGTASRVSDYFTGNDVKLKMSVLPNPAHNELNVQIADNGENMNISIYDTYGRRVMQKNSTGSNTILDISALPPGVYMLKAGLKNTEFSSVKFVKK